MRPPPWLRRRPWIWLIVLYLFVLGVHAVFVWVAQRNPPLPAEGYAPSRGDAANDTGGGTPDG